MNESLQVGLHVAAIAGICIFTWSVASSLEAIANALGRIADGVAEKRNDP